MLDAYDGSLPHPRSKSAYQNDRGNFVCTDDEGANPKPTDCLYHFNSLGYRGEEFDPAARLKIFVSGCSYTFGLGVQHDQTWPALLKKLVADKLDVPIDQTNLQNFSQLGASNGYIARTIVRQCERVRPDLAVIAFTHRERTEYLAPGVTRNLGLWDLDVQEPGWSVPTVRYLSQYNVESASLDLLKNMLLVQWAMVRRRIPYLLLWMNRTGIDQSPINDLMPLRHLRGMIDPARLSSRCLLEPGIMVDTNPVDRHPGPGSHANFAPKVLEALDLSAPPSPASFAIGDTDVGKRRDDALPQRRILVIGPAKLGEDFGCTNSHCVCRRLAVRHKFLAEAVGRPLAENASNDRIVRTLLTECSGQRPDFVFASFSDSRSCEHFLGEALVELHGASPDSPTHELAKLAEAYRQYTTQELCDLNALRNILMAQEFLETQRVPYILSIPPAFSWRDMNAPGRHPVLRMYASLINPTSLCNRGHRETVAVEKHDDGRPPRRGATEITRELVKRLKRRFKKSRTEDPNIYPLW